MKLAVCLFLASIGLCAYGQADRTSVTGTVVDTSGALVPNAAITVTDTRTAEARNTTSGEDGRYVFVNLIPSVYTIVAQAPGLGPATYTEINLVVGQERTVNIILQPASVSSEVTVSAGELTTIDVSSAAIGTTINSREVATLPLNGRQLSQLYLLVPGAQTAGGGSYDNIRFSGMANQQNEIKIDGIEASSIIDASPGNLDGEVSTGFRLQSSLETVEEFNVKSSNYPAEYGTGDGGQITVITKSGGNQFHGTMFDYIRNDAMDARNFYDKATKTPLKLNQFGASVGGAIVRNKAFFFGDYEGLRQRSGTNLIATVPSLAARAIAVPSIQPLLAGYPIGQTHTSNPLLDIAQINGSNPINEDYGNLRLDYHLSDKYTMFLRYSRDQGYLQSPLDVSGSYSQVTAVPQNLVYTLQQLLSPTIINETKIGFNGAKTRIAGYAPDIPGVDVASGIAVSFAGKVAIPGIGGQGASAAASTLGNLVRGNSSQNGRREPYTGYTLSFIDNLSVIKQNHNLKFGVEFRPITLWTDRQGGTTYTFPSIDALLANQPSNIQWLSDVSAPDPWHNGITGVRKVNQYYLIGYAQDEWKLKPTITINYGLRYEYYHPLTEARGLGVLFNAYTGQIEPSNKSWYRSSKLNFGPRVGIAWSPSRFHDKTVFRIGAGYYYGPGQTEDQIQPIDSDRASTTLTSNIAFPINPAQLLANYNINNPNLGYQPRGYAPTYTIPERILSYTASWQQQLPGDTVLTVAYVGSQGRNLFLRSWTNGIVGVNMNPTTGAGIPVLQFGNRFAQVDFKTSGGTMHYDSLQTTVNRRFSKGLTAGFQWTYGHSIGNTGGSNEAQTTQNPFYYGQDHGNNAFDVRHSINLSLLYQLPFQFQNRLAKLLGSGWEVGGILNGRTGLPMDITISRPDIVYQVNGTDTYVASPIVQSGRIMTTPVVNNPYGGAFRSNRRPDVVQGVDPFLKGANGTTFLNPAAFAIPQPGKFGNLGRFALHGPGMSQLDLTLHKIFPIREQMNMEFRAEVYNIFNKANFNNPPAVLNYALGTGANQIQPGSAYTAAAAGSSFGVLNSTVSNTIGLGAQRQIQLSLRFNF